MDNHAHNARGAEGGAAGQQQSISGSHVPFIYLHAQHVEVEEEVQGLRVEPVR